MLGCQAAFTQRCSPHQFGVFHCHWDINLRPPTIGCKCRWSVQRVVISRRTRGNTVPIITVSENAHELAVHALWTALRIIFWPKCNRLQDFAYTISTFFEGDTLGPLQREGATSSQRPRCLDPDTNFHLARQRSHCYCFTKLSLQSGLCGATNRLIVCGCIDKMLISDVGPAATASSYGVVTDVSANARS